MNKTNWEELDDDIREEYLDKAADLLGNDTLICTRVWEAWSYGTMNQSDFVLAYECDDRVEEVARELYKFVQFERKKIWNMIDFIAPKHSSSFNPKILCSDENPFNWGNFGCKRCDIIKDIEEKERKR